MKKDVKQTYTEPWFVGTKVMLESTLCAASGEQVVDKSTDVNIEKQSGWDESTQGTISIDTWETN